MDAGHIGLGNCESSVLSEGNWLREDSFVLAPREGRGRNRQTPRWPQEKPVAKWAVEVRIVQGYVAKSVFHVIDWIRAPKFHWIRSCVVVENEVQYIAVWSRSTSNKLFTSNCESRVYTCPSRPTRVV